MGEEARIEPKRALFEVKRAPDEELLEALEDGAPSSAEVLVVSFVVVPVARIRDERTTRFKFQLWVSPVPQRPLSFAWGS